MICRPCRDAADQQQPRDAHCQAAGGPDSPCCCQHRTERYRRDEEQPQ